jgi:hypothetical protein
VSAFVTTAISFTAHSSPFQDASSPQQLKLYVRRGDSYLKSSDYRRALDEFRAAAKEFPKCADSIERWRLISETPYRKHYIDIRTADFSEKASNRFWVKMLITTQGRGLADKVQETVSQWEIDCGSKRLRVLEVTSYDAKGGVIETIENEHWNNTIVPESIGEIIYTGVCREKE